MNMIKKVCTLLLLTVIATMTILMTNMTKSMATQSSSPLYLGLYNHYNGRPRDGATFGTPDCEIFYGFRNTEDRMKPIIKIYEYTGTAANSPIKDPTQEIYCLRCGSGFGSDREYNGNTITAYTNYFNLYDKNNIPATFSSVLPTGTNFNKLLWVLDHIGNPYDDENMAKVLEAAGVYHDDTHTTIDTFKYKTYNSIQPMGDYEYRNAIEAIQQAVIWNYSYKNATYQPKAGSIPGGIHYDYSRDQTYPYDLTSNTYNDPTDNPMTQLANYLLSGAEANPDYQGSEQATASFDKSRAKVVIQSGSYLAGPYRYSGNVDLDRVTITTPGNAEYTLVGENGTSALSGANDKEKINRNKNKDFYVRVNLMTGETINAGQLSIELEATYTKKNLTYWAVAASDITNNQPVVVITEEEVPFSASATIQLQSLHFDLALRKYITRITDASGNVKYDEAALNNRVPNIATPPVFNLGINNWTATKAHSKQAISVATGDIVEYKIVVYNEGDVAGTGITVTDYIPTGLTVIDSEGWTAGAKESTGYTPYTKTLGSVGAFDGNKLPEISSTIKCKVTQTASEDRSVVLKNVAEITASSNVHGLPDRDSTVNNQETRISYAAPQSEQGIGYEDDDDYENLYIPAETPQRFDLAIRKHITKVEKADGTVRYDETALNNRVPTISEPPTFNLGDANTTATKQHEKDALLVEPGDKVTYEIIVYNEGNVDATDIVVKDYLPDGLKYVSGGWTKGSTTNGYTDYSYTYGNLSAYDGGNQLPTIKHTITCEVTSEASTTGRINLKNVTEIISANNALDKNDRDSEPNNENHRADYAAPNSERGIGYQDDDDYEHIYIEKIEEDKKFDLALRKFLIKINNNELKTNGKYDREPTCDTSTFTYTFPEAATKPAVVAYDDVVTYVIRVYNEGNVSGYASEIKDDIPDGLEFLPTHSTNVANEWKMLDKDGNETTDVTKAVSVVTRKFGHDSSSAHLLHAFDPATMTNNPDHLDVEIAFKVVKKTNEAKATIINSAQISDDEDEDGNPVEDEDSDPDNMTPEHPNEDDEDIEQIIPKEFDLALKKFIVQVNDTVLKTGDKYDREPTVDTSTFTYTFPSKVTNQKNPVRVCQNDIVTYIIRVYNEGSLSGYASVIKDDIPDGLEFLPTNSTNTSNGWKMLDKDGNETTDVKKAVSVITEKFAYDGTGKYLLDAFDPATMTNNPDHLDVEIAFKVVAPKTEDRITINSAEISDDQDENGKPVKDKDSDTDNMTPKTPKEDDEDIEKIYVKYFDLALKKWVTQAIIIEDGVEKIKNTGYGPEDKELVKVELNEQRIKNTIIKFKYSIRIINEGEIPGTATEITEYVPQGLKFNQADNPKWKEENGKITTDQLKDVVIQPGEYKDIDVILTWINSEENIKAMDNIAEISKDHNDSGTPDIDSTPDNKEPNEDDIDHAPVILVIVTGSAKTYLGLTAGVLAIIVSGAVIVKKKVLA